MPSYTVQYLRLPLDLDALISPTRRLIVLNSDLSQHRLTEVLRAVQGYAAIAEPAAPPAPSVARLPARAE